MRGSSFKRQGEKQLREAVTEVQRARTQQLADLDARVEAAAKAHAARPRLTLANLTDAKAIRNTYGWHVVVRVNAKTVTVETPYSWNDHVRHGDVLEVRK